MVMTVALLIIAFCLKENNLYITWYTGNIEMYILRTPLIYKLLREFSLESYHPVSEKLKIFLKEGK